jgi:hypothetical protein
LLSDAVFCSDAMQMPALVEAMSTLEIAKEIIQ